MAIKHLTTKAAGQRLFAVADWNANHTIDPNTITTLEVNFADQSLNQASSPTFAGVTLGDSMPRTNTKAKVYLTSNQENIAQATYTLINFNAETYDIGSDFNPATHLFTAPVTGYYLITWMLTVKDAAAAGRVISRVVVDGVGDNYSKAEVHNPIDHTSVGCSVVLGVVAGKTIGLQIYFAGVATGDVEGAGTQMSIHLLSV